jgi:hypothetical protein
LRTGLFLIFCWAWSFMTQSQNYRIVYGARTVEALVATAKRSTTWQNPLHTATSRSRKGKKVIVARNHGLARKRIHAE